MGIKIDRSAFHDAFEAYWGAQTGTDHGLEAFLTTYLDRTGLTDVHEAAVAKHEAFRNKFAGLRGPARLEAAE